MWFGRVVARTTDARYAEQGRRFFGSLSRCEVSRRSLSPCTMFSWLNPIHESGLVRNSYLMVDMFFVLSGFVMCHGYGDRIRNRGDLRDFIALRFSRVYRSMWYYLPYF